MYSPPHFLFFSEREGERLSGFHYLCCILRKGVYSKALAGTLFSLVMQVGFWLESSKKKRKEKKGGGGEPGRDGGSPFFPAQGFLIIACTRWSFSIQLNKCVHYKETYFACDIYVCRSLCFFPFLIIPTAFAAVSVLHSRCKY